MSRRSDKPPELGSLLRQTSPLRWGFDAWASIAGVAGCIVLAVACILSLLSLSFPRPGFLLLMVITSFLTGLVLSLVISLFVWVVVVPLRWSVRCLRWRLGGMAPSPTP